MPLVKIHVEESVWQSHRDQLIDALKPVREMLCETFKVEPSICQLAIVPVWGVDDQAPVAAEMQILPKPDRTPDLIRGACERLRDVLSEASDSRVVIRTTQLNPETYLALK
ncbi:hypothetical protein [Rhizobium leguminosarum]|uniref:hypothetical protein n=1 Tax=Rhizobium leguminosarum TaxID=384 RepID=UPI001F23AA0D|nr:hypothetical protein [Rhizobium leguminosarum]UIJ83199.1 hypothetical protein LZK78_32515 [Rhizobium leguminosarum]